MENIVSTDLESNVDKAVLIMAGGVGSRFWPASRESRPKQFLDVLGVGKSLLRLTFERCNKLVPASHVFIITNELYAGLVKEHLPELDEDQIFLEPSHNNTAPCIALASLKLKKRLGNVVCLIAPSDQVIMEESAFLTTVKAGMEYASGHDALVTMGINPSRPDTGYGYIHYDTESNAAAVHQVRRFTEKPDRETAEAFIRAGDYLWNSGMFIWTLESILAAYTKSSPAILNLLAPGMDKFFTEEEQPFLSEYYPQTEKTSVDYAIMERMNNVYVIPSDFGWTDLGTWDSLYQYLPKDDNDNVCIGKMILANDTKSCLIRSNEETLVVTSGVKDLVIVCDKDTVLIFNRDNEQVVKKLRQTISESDWEIAV